MSDATQFDAWHADVANSATCNRIFRQSLGLPPEIASNSLLSNAGIAEVVAALRLAEGQVLADLACGRGGYGREVGRRAGARLVGVDFSAVAVGIAARDGSYSPAGFCVGDFTALGLRDHSADAVMCIDAVQFSDPPVAVLRECRRILAPGGRLAVTCWEPADAGAPDAGSPDERLPERIRRMNLARDLAEAGFARIDVTVRPDWHATERTLWEAALAVEADGDPALVSVQSEAARSLAAFDLRRRVFATAIAPAA
jgi:SAM-dependent methyltransferase